MKIFLNNLIGIIFIFFSAVYQIITGIFRGVFKVVGKIINDVSKNVYGRFIALLGLILFVALINYLASKSN